MGSATCTGTTCAGFATSASLRRRSIESLPRGGLSTQHLSCSCPSPSSAKSASSSQTLSQRRGLVKTCATTSEQLVRGNTGGGGGNPEASSAAEARSTRNSTGNRRHGRSGGIERGLTYTYYSNSNSSFVRGARGVSSSSALSENRHARRSITVRCHVAAARTSRSPEPPPLAGIATAPAAAAKSAIAIAAAAAGSETVLLTDQQPDLLSPSMIAGDRTAATTTTTTTLTPPAMTEREEEERLRYLTERTIGGIPKDEFLRLSKPARYLGNEFGAVHKAWRSASVRFSLTYPEIYEVGASNLGHIVLYTVLNDTDGLLCDRCYMPGDDMAAKLRQHNLPLFAVESRRSLSEFDCLGFSLSYELGATNVLEMLSLSGIPLTWEARLGNDDDDDKPWNVEMEGGGSNSVWPLVFAGGPTATSNPEPFSDFFDFFALGDGEDSLPEIGRCLQQCKAEGLSRRSTLRKLASTVAGVYVPQFYERLEGWGGAVFPKEEGVPARVVRRVSMPDPFQQIGLVPYVETVHDRLTVEIRRGCTRGCRFCQPGMLTRPARDVDPDRVVQAVTDGMRKTGYNEFSLLSLSCSDYLALPAVGIEIRNRLKGEPISLALPSQRVDRFDDNIANIIGGARKGGLTFAPEAGTQRLRDIINKGLTNEELLRGVKTAWDKGFKQVKLYFMIGLPGETDADVRGIVETVKWLQSQCRRGKQRIGIRLTISNFSPKPHTPFQWHSVSTAEFQRKQRFLRRELSRLHGVKFNLTDVRISAMEDFLSRGDRRLGKVILRAWQLGATNDAWWGNLDDCFAKWSQAIEESGLSWKYRQVEEGEWDVLEKLGDGQYRGQGQGGKGRLDRGNLADDRLDAPLPWDVIDTGVAKWWLKADLQRALEAATVPDCAHSGLCSECGVCGEEFGENVVAEVPPIPEFVGQFVADQRRTQRLRITFGKEGSMVYVGHLDLMHLFDRAMRRASLPVAFDGGFHSMPQIAAAMPLPLGHSSCAELLDVYLTERVGVDECKRRLAEQLPHDLPILNVEALPVKHLNGKYYETTGKLLVAAEYVVLLHPREEDEEVVGEEREEEREKEEREEGIEEEGGVLLTAVQQSVVVPDLTKYKEWIREVLSMETCMVARPAKEGKKEKVVDARPLLFEFEVYKGVLPKAMRAPHAPSRCQGDVIVRFVGKCGGDLGLRIEDVLEMLRQVAGLPFVAAHVHRNKFILSEPVKPKPNVEYLTSVVRDEGFRALYRRFDGTSRIHSEDGTGSGPTQAENYVDAARIAREASLSRP